MKHLSRNEVGRVTVTDVDSSATRFYESSTVDLNQFDLNFFALLMSSVSAESSMKVDDSPTSVRGALSSTQMNKFDRVSWVGYIVWSAKLMSKFKSHEEHAYQLYSKLSYCEKIWKTMSYPHPLLNLKAPFTLLEVDRTRSYWKDDDGTYYVPVFEKTVAENAQIPIEARSWDLVIPSMCANVGDQMLRNVQTTVVVWGAEQAISENSEGEPSFPKGHIRFETNETPSFIIYHHEQISEERMSELKFDFESSELACFVEQCTLSEYENGKRGDVVIQLISRPTNSETSGSDRRHKRVRFSMDNMSDSSDHFTSSFDTLSASCSPVEDLTTSSGSSIIKQQLTSVENVKKTTLQTNEPEPKKIEGNLDQTGSSDSDNCSFYSAYSCTASTDNEGTEAKPVAKVSPLGLTTTKSKISCTRKLF